MQCFAIKKSQIEGRLDLLYYLPDIRLLEEKVTKISQKTLGDYVANISGGATPKIDEGDKHYTNADNGIPFLRVQNVASTSHLNLEGLKYITHETHEGLLRRSQVKPGNLITKITGVGRMAVSAVAPTEFFGNINQHLVVIDTEDAKISHALAVYLNTDIGERLASRRSTGGTRPALDYKSLLSIPVIINHDAIKLIDNAYKEKNQKESKAEALLNSIDDYVLGELGIEFPEIQTRKCFTVDSAALKGTRHDPLYYSQEIFSFIENIEHARLSDSDLIEYMKSGFAAGKQDQELEETNDAIIHIRPTNLDERGKLKFDRNVYINKDTLEARDSDVLQKSEVLFNNTNSQEMVGKTAFFNLEGNYFSSNHMTRIKTNDEKLHPFYLACILNFYQRINVFYNICTNWNNQSGVNTNLLASIPIPLPSPTVQKKIADEVQKRMAHAEQLKKEAVEELEAAKQQVEKMILGGK